MRPRLLHLGYIDGSGLAPHEVYASMRPRLLHLGYLLVFNIFFKTSQASMRPRLLHLGSANAAAKSAPHSELQ